MREPVPRRCLARITHASTNGGRIPHARSPMLQRSLLSAPVNATLHRIRSRTLASSTDVRFDLMPEMAEKRAIRFAHLGADPLTSSASASSTVMRPFASRKHRLQWEACMRALSVNEQGCHSSHATTKPRDRYASASVACMRR